MKLYIHVRGQENTILYTNNTATQKQKHTRQSHLNKSQNFLFG